MDNVICLLTWRNWKLFFVTKLAKDGV